jgi:hypothetical protein
VNAKAPENWRSPKPGGNSDDSVKTHGHENLFVLGSGIPASGF